MQLNDALIAITGGARGLGLAMAHHLGRRGARVALIDTDNDQLDQAVNGLFDAGITARAFVANVADEASVTEAFADIREHMGPLDGLVNNAGILRDGLLTISSGTPPGSRIVRVSSSISRASRAPATWGRATMPRPRPALPL